MSALKKSSSNPSRFLATAVVLAIPLVLVSCGDGVVNRGDPGAHPPLPPALTATPNFGTEESGPFVMVEWQAVRGIEHYTLHRMPGDYRNYGSYEEIHTGGIGEQICFIPNQSERKDGVASFDGCEFEVEGDSFTFVDRGQDIYAPFPVGIEHGETYSYDLRICQDAQPFQECSAPTPSFFFEEREKLCLDGTLVTCRLGGYARVDLPRSSAN